jgi:hypothetical protein
MKNNRFNSVNTFLIPFVVVASLFTILAIYPYLEKVTFYPNSFLIGGILILAGIGVFLVVLSKNKNKSNDE